MRRKRATFDRRVRADVGGADAAGDQRELAEAHAGRQRRQPFVAAFRKVDRDADVAFDEEVQRIRRIAAPHDRRARFEFPPFDEPFEISDVGRADACTKAMFRKALDRGVFAFDGIAFEQLAFTPFDAEIEVRLKGHRRHGAWIEFGIERCEQLAAPHPGEDQMLALAVAAAHERGEHTRCGEVDVCDFFEIEHRKVERLGAIDDLAHDPLDRRKAQVALQFVDRRA